MSTKKEKARAKPSFRYNADYDWFTFKALDLELSVSYFKNGKVRDVWAFNEHGALMSYPRRKKGG
jgi:hypothetical protein